MCCLPPKSLNVIQKVFWLSEGCAKTSYAILHMQWHRPMSKRSIKPPYSISRATSIDSDCCRLPTANVLTNEADKSCSNQFWSTSPSFSRPHVMHRNKKNCNTVVHGGGGLELVKPAREPAFSRPKHCVSLKKPHESCPFAAPCWPS